MATTIHIASGLTAAGAVEQALRLVDEESDVHGFYDPLSVGPLLDIESTGALRRQFWAKFGEPDPDLESNQTNDADVWQRLASPEVTTIVWRGLDADGYLLSLRAAWKLRHSGGRLLEIVNRSFRLGLDEFFSTIAVQEPEHLATLRASANELKDIDHRADLWSAICQKSGVMFRDLLGGVLRELPEDAYDAELIERCTPDWQKAARVIGHTMAEVHTGDAILLWRMKELIRTGALIGRGSVEIRMLEVRLP